MTRRRRPINRAEERRNTQEWLRRFQLSLDFVVTHYKLPIDEVRKLLIEKKLMPDPEQT